jgi:hypothetical protein
VSECAGRWTRVVSLLVHKTRLLVHKTRRLVCTLVLNEGGRKKKSIKSNYISTIFTFVRGEK